jgi:hypothetical protein
MLPQRRRNGPPASLSPLWSSRSAGCLRECSELLKMRDVVMLKRIHMFRLTGIES